MTRHLLRLIWNRKRTNFLMVLEIFVSFIVLFAVVGVGVYTLDNWRRPIGFSYDHVWDVSIDMKQVSDDDFTQQQAETVRQVMLVFREFPEIEQTAGTMLAPYEFGSSSSAFCQLAVPAFSRSIGMCADGDVSPLRASSARISAGVRP